jgi:hypothetical protein
MASTTINIFLYLGLNMYLITVAHTVKFIFFYIYLNLQTSYK